jgi:hypothetical protein
MYACQRTTAATYVIHAREGTGWGEGMPARAPHTTAATYAIGHHCLTVSLFVVDRYRGAAMSSVIPLCFFLILSFSSHT